MSNKNNKSDEPIKRKRGRPRKNKTQSKKNTEDNISIKNSYDKNKEIILHLAINFNDVKKYGEKHNNTEETTSTPTESVFTLTDTPSNDSSNSSSNFENIEHADININELVNKIKYQNKIIYKFQSELEEYKKIINKQLSHGIINNKIYKMDIKFINIKNNKQIIQEKTNIVCWWCTYNFDNIPCFIPEKIINDTYYVFGCFCSYNCAAAYNLQMNDYKIWDRYSLIKKLYYKIYEKNNIFIAPAREVLKKFGGPLSIEEFRKDSIKGTKEYRLIMPPMKSIIPYVEEIYKNSYIIQNIKMNNSADNLVLKRIKPLPNSKNNLYNFKSIIKK